jgi:hypothetical protein
MPRAAATLGFELITVDSERGTVEIAFAAREDFATSLVDAQGGVIAMATARRPSFRSRGPAPRRRRAPRPAG